MRSVVTTLERPVQANQISEWQRIVDENHVVLSPQTLAASKSGVYANVFLAGEAC